MLVDEVSKKIYDLGSSRKQDELENLIDGIETKALIELIIKNLNEIEFISLWNHTLVGFTTSSKSIEKRFTFVMAVLEKIKTIKLLKSKQIFDMVTRLFIDFQTYTKDQLIELVEFCVGCIQNNTEFVGWKDLLPEIFTILRSNSNLNVNGITMTGEEYRAQVIRNLCTMRWPKTVLTPIASMFREISITADERSIILGKICENLQKFDPLELPPLSFQLFSLCTTASLVIVPIMAFQKYFHRNYYKKLFIDMDSESTDFDSIENFSEKDFRNAEETILYHLGSCTEFTITENEIVNVLKGIAMIPQFILSPFMISAILTMCNINRYPETARMLNSPGLNCLRDILKNNEAEKEMVKLSAWCRTTNVSHPVEFEKILSVLIDQNRDGTDVITPGIVGLSFILLKAKNHSPINKIGVSFLQKFLKKRFVFGRGIVKKLSEFMFADQDAAQYAECLTTLSLTNTLTIAESTEIVEGILNDFLLIPGETAMKMLSFVFPLVKISSKIRDALIEMLRRAMYHRDLATRKMAVFGFCVLLKQLKVNNARRSNLGATASFSQSMSISGYSLMSQTAINSAENPQRHLDIMTLEILGMLRKTFSQSSEIKRLMYEYLMRAFELNQLIIPNVLQFIDLHFRTLFEIDDLKIVIRFDKIVRDRGNGAVEEIECLGELMSMVVIAIYFCTKNTINYETEPFQKFFDTLIDRIDLITLEQLGILGALDVRMCKIGNQYLNCLEALMSYCLWMASTENNYLEKLRKLFKYHQDCYDTIRGMTSSKKGQKQKRDDKTIPSGNTTTQSTTAARLTITFRPVNIWDLATLDRFMEIIHNPANQLINKEKVNALRVHREFGRYVLRCTIARIKAFHSEPEYKHIQNSRRLFMLICSLAKILYANCVSRLDDLCTNFDGVSGELSAECFLAVLHVGNTFYGRKFNEILGTALSLRGGELVANSFKMIDVLQNLVLKFFSNSADSVESDDGSDENILAALLDCLEILYSYIPGDCAEAEKISNWLFKLCETHKIQSKCLFVVHKLMFTERIKTESGIFFDSVAGQLQTVVGRIDEELELAPCTFTLKSISLETAESCLTHLCGVLKKQLDDVKYFTTKVKCYLNRLKIGGLVDSQEYHATMKTMERSICSQLIYVAKTLTPLANTQFMPGPSMNTLIRIMTEFFICATNLTKHLILRHPILPVSFQSTKFDQLVRVAGKPFAKRIYNQITFIEENVISDGTTDGSKKKKKIDPNVNKYKVLAASKFLPRLILCLENFNKFVIVLSKKTKSDLSMHLHMGTVRDFRIKTSDLKEAIELNKLDDPQMADDVDDLDMNELTEADKELLRDEDDDDDDDDVEDIGIGIQDEQILKNLKEINKKAVRSAKESGKSELIVVDNPHVAAGVKQKQKNKKGRKRKSPDTTPTSADESMEPLQVTESTESSRRSSKRMKK